MYKYYENIYFFIEVFLFYFPKYAFQKTISNGVWPASLLWSCLHLASLYLIGRESSHQELSIMWKRVRCIGQQSVYKRWYLYLYRWMQNRGTDILSHSSGHYFESWTLIFPLDELFVMRKWYKICLDNNKNVFPTVFCDFGLYYVLLSFNNCNQKALQ